MIEKWSTPTLKNVHKENILQQIFTPSPFLLLQIGCVTIIYFYSISNWFFTWTEKSKTAVVSCAYDDVVTTSQVLNVKKVHDVLEIVSDDDEYDESHTIVLKAEANEGMYRHEIILFTILQRDCWGGGGY